MSVLNFEVPLARELDSISLHEEGVIILDKLPNKLTRRHCGTVTSMIQWYGMTGSNDLHNRSSNVSTGIERRKMRKKKIRTIGV